MAELFDESMFKRSGGKSSQPKSKFPLWLGLLVGIVVVMLVVQWCKSNETGDDQSKSRIVSVLKSEMTTIDLNHATLRQLMALPSIGEVTAKDIIKNRPYNEVEDLKKVKGIGPKTFEKLRDKVRVDP